MSIARIFSRSIRPLMGLRQASTDISQLFEESDQPKGQAIYQDDVEKDPQSGRYGSAYPQPQRRMNKGVNRVELLGGVAGDPVFKITQRGSEFASFNLYTNVDRKLGNGNLVTNTEVHNVVAFGGVAKYIQQNLHRGSRVYLTGRLHYTGGMLLADGTRTPRMASINVENVYPLARAARRDSATQEKIMSALAFSKFLFRSRHASQTAFRFLSSDNAPTVDNKPQGWISRILTGPRENAIGRQAQSHSSLLSVGDAIYEMQTHDVIGGDREQYLQSYKKYAAEVTGSTPGAMLLGSWFVIFGNQNQVVNLWRFEKGYTDLDSHIKSLLNNPALKAVELEYARLCGRRRTVITKPFSYWGEPKERTTPHIYDLRSYVLKPGTMIEWGNAWAKGITYRREFNQDVGGFFSQIGQLYLVFHIWAYPSMVNRNTTRQMTWNKPGWDSTVEYTVPLIKKMQSRILVPNEISKLK